MRIKWFQMTATAVIIVFFGIMALVTGIAYSRKSGSTGLDMAQIHKIRLDVTYKNIDPSAQIAENKK